MIEIQSQPDESDRTRMLVQAACIARLAHKHRRSSGSSVIITAIYIDDRGEASRYFFCIPADSTAEVSKQVTHERR